MGTVDCEELALNVGYERIWFAEIRVKFSKVGKSRYPNISFYTLDYGFVCVILSYQTPLLNRESNTQIYLCTKAQRTHKIKAVHP